MHTQFKTQEKISVNDAWTLDQLQKAFDTQGADVVTNEFVDFDANTILICLNADEQARFLRAVIDRSGLNDAYTMPDCDLPVITAAVIENGTLDPWKFVEGLSKLE